MRPHLLSRNAATTLRHHVKRARCFAGSTRPIVTLAIETSCDDTCVAVAESTDSLPCGLKVHFHEKITANNDAYNGIHPLVALQSHQANLAPLVQKALSSAPRPDFVSATRGPGMRSNLSVGLNIAKGVALGLNVPLIGVHHMQAHALTPRLVHAMEHCGHIKPAFPFLSVLISGGHTLLINSTGLVEHAILAETKDIALGDCLDKAARAILPLEAQRAPYGRALEDFAFPEGLSTYDYVPPARRQEELERRQTRWTWSLAPPLANSKSGEKTSKRMAYSFAGLLSAVQRFTSDNSAFNDHQKSETRQCTGMSTEERRDMAREVQRLAFEHVASRILLHLSSGSAPDVKTVVVSGGVASNSFLRHVFRAFLDIRGHSDIAIEFPPVSLCTDNALMIAWTGLEMYRAGYRSSLNIEPLRKWSMDCNADDGGIIGAGGWTNTAER